MHDHPLAVGIVGTGAFGTRIGGQLEAIPGVTVAGLADVDGDALAAAGERLAVAVDRRFTDYRALLSTVDLDAVVVATPHVLHYEQITAALDRGLHVLSEKPLVVDLEHNRELLARTSDDDEVLMIGYQRHLDEAFRRVRDRYRSTPADGPPSAVTGPTERDPDVPAPTRVTAEITEDWIGPFADSWRTNPELSAGGYVTDTGRHLVDAVCWTTGLEPASVRAEMSFASPDVEQSAVLTVDFAGGARAVISAFGDARSVRETYHFWDDEGGARLFGRGWGDRTLVTVDADGGEYRPHLDRSRQRTKGAAFVDAIREGVPVPAGPRDAFRAQAVIEAAYESARTGDRVAVPRE
jgi:predicted dehydrogenase